MAKSKSPVRPIRQIIVDSGSPGYINRILVATPTRGTVRMEWVGARYGQIVPTNWSMVQMNQFLSSYIPLRFNVPDAQNLIVNEALKHDYEWLLLIEDDTIPPENLFIKMNQYMRDGKVPVVSGLYYTKSVPSEPLVYRGRGTGAYMDFKHGDKVWADGVPTGCLLIHHSILREMFKESPEYVVNNQVVRRVFETPTDHYQDPEGNVSTKVGTSDLEWCTRVMKGKYFEKAGWPEFQKKKYPFLVDSSIFCRHITEAGVQFPQEF